MTLYIIRHADPDYENDTITEFGWKEANALAEWLKDVKIDKIYTSPRGRAIDTAKPTCEIKGMTSEILEWTEESHDYMAVGDMTPDSQCTYSYSVQKGIYDFKDFKNNNRIKTIENMIRNSDEFLAARGYVREGGMYRIERDNDESIAVFCHNGFGTAWIGHLIGLAPGLSFFSLLLNTSSVTTIEFNREFEHGYTRPELRHMGEVHHLYKAGLPLQRNK